MDKIIGINTIEGSLGGKDKVIQCAPPIPKNIVSPWMKRSKLQKKYLLFKILQVAHGIGYSWDFFILLNKNKINVFS